MTAVAVRADARTAVNQPPYGGSYYPFAGNCALSPLFLDLKLELEPGGSRAPAAYLQYAYGFSSDGNLFGLLSGDNAHLDLQEAGALELMSAHPRWYPAHARDILIVDIDGGTVYDSAIESSYLEYPWGSNRAVASWVSPYGCLHLVFRTDLGASYLPTGPTGLLSHRLDPRAYQVDAAKVRAVRVGSSVFSGNVKVVAGYNVELKAGSPAAVGLRTSTDISVDGVPGTGAGLFSDCGSNPVSVYTVDESPPTSSGDLPIYADPCFRFSTPATLRPPVAGIRHLRYGNDAVLEADAPHTLQIDDDCREKCPCLFYVQTYRALRRVWRDAQAQAAVLSGARDDLVELDRRWNAASACYEASPLQSLSVGEPLGRLGTYASFCNFGHCCLVDAELRFSAFTYAGGSPISSSSPSFLEGVLSDGESGELPVVPDVYRGSTGFVIAVRLPLLEARRTLTARLRSYVPSARGHTLRIYTSVHFGASVQPVWAPGATSPTFVDCASPTETPPTELSALWTALGVPSKTTRVTALRSVALNPDIAPNRCQA